MDFFTGTVIIYSHQKTTRLIVIDAHLAKSEPEAW